MQVGLYLRILVCIGGAVLSGDAQAWAKVLPTHTQSFPRNSSLTEAYTISEVRFATHLRAMCTVFANTYVHWNWALFVWRCALERTSVHIVSYAGFSV